MFCQKAILVVEDDPLIAAFLALAIEDAEGRVVGPFASVAEALAVLATEKVAAAIVDAHLADGEVTPLALDLAAQGVPFVVFTGTGLPSNLSAIMPNLPVVMKPATPIAVLSRLTDEILSFEIAMS